MQITNSKAKIKVPANFHLQDTQRNQEMSRPPFKFCIMLKLRNLNVLSVHKMKNHWTIILKWKFVKIPSCNIFASFAEQRMLHADVEGKGAHDNFLPQKRGGVKLVGELIHVQ